MPETTTLWATGPECTRYKVQEEKEIEGTTQQIIYSEHWGLRPKNN